MNDSLGIRVRTRDGLLLIEAKRVKVAILK